MKKQPEKTAQTRQRMINAFWEIAEKKGISKVIISEVTKCAGFNRGTFYVYFSDVDDLLYQAEQEIISDLCPKISSVIANAGTLDFQSVSSRAMEVFGRYDDKLFLLLGKAGDPLFLDRVRKEIAAIFAATLQPIEEDLYQDYIIAYITSAFTGLLQFWHEKGKELPLTELSGIAQRMAFYGLTGGARSSMHLLFHFYK